MLNPLGECGRTFGISSLEVLWEPAQQLVHRKGAAFSAGLPWANPEDLGFFWGFVPVSNNDASVG